MFSLQVCKEDAQDLENCLWFCWDRFFFSVLPGAINGSLQNFWKIRLFYSVEGEKSLSNSLVEVRRNNTKYFYCYMELSAFIAYKISYVAGCLSYLQWKKLEKESATIYLVIQNILLFFTAHFTLPPISPDSASSCVLQMFWDTLRISSQRRVSEK